MIKTLRKLELFQELKNETIESLGSIGSIVSYKKGIHIFHDREKVETVYIIVSGKVSLYKISENAQKKIIFILGEGKVINDVMLDNLPSSINCEVFEDAEILCFNKDKFIKVMESDFELTKIIINSLSKKVRRLYRQIKNSTPKKVEKRVAAKLLKLSKDYGIECEEGILINLKITITYLSDMFGAPRETISRALKTLQQEKLILFKGRSIIITNRNGLSEYFKKQ